MLAFQAIITRKKKRGEAQLIVIVYYESDMRQRQPICMVIVRYATIPEHATTPSYSYKSRLFRSYARSIARSDGAAQTDSRARLMHT